MHTQLQDNNTIQLGEKRGVAPANYLQILANSTATTESIYDSPRSRNTSGVLPSTNHDVYINTNRSTVDESFKSTEDGVCSLFTFLQNCTISYININL